MGLFMCLFVNTAVIVAQWKSCQPSCDLQTAELVGAAHVSVNVCVCVIDKGRAL